MKRNNISYIIIGVLITLLVVSNFWHKSDINTDNVVKTVIVKDTVFLNSVDTIRIEKPKVIQTIIRDTIIAKMQGADSLKLVYESKVYGDSLYKAYVSGYNVNLDSIDVYKKTITKEINTEITRIIRKESWNLYFDCGVSKINDCIAPNVGLSLSMPNGFKIGGEMGTYDKNVYYGIKIGYRIK